MLSRIRKYKWIIPLLICSFGLSAVGVHLEVHLCHGHVASVKLVSLDNKESSNKACCPGMCMHEEEDNGCCDDEEISAALDYDGIVLIAEDMDTKPVHYATLMDLGATSSQVMSSEHIVLSDTGPPPLSGYLLRIRLQSFLC